MELSMDIKQQEKLSAWGSIVSSVASFFGGYQVCHSICLALVAALSVVGIVVVGMPLEFLTRIALPAWLIGLFLLIVTSALYLKKKCVSKHMLLINGGILIAGTPFLQQYAAVLWSIGGLGIIGGIASYVQQRKKKSCH